jgi:hypothetical protein
VQLCVAKTSFGPDERPIKGDVVSNAVLRLHTLRGTYLARPNRRRCGGKVVHIDPWSSGNYDGLPPADLILITDIHGDHMDPKILARARSIGWQSR